jgi:cytochrome c oxidase cbb3-type subunit 3
MKKYLSTAAFFGMSLSVYAQEVAAQSTAAADPHLFQKIMTTSIFVAGTIVVVAAILMLLRLSEILSKNIVNQYLTDTNNGATAATPKKQGKSLLQRLTDAVPVDKQDDIAFDHAFDGIRELDNKLPPWWVWMFYITIAIGVVYFNY